MNEQEITLEELYQWREEERQHILITQKRNEVLSKAFNWDDLYQTLRSIDAEIEKRRNK